MPKERRKARLKRPRESLGQDYKPTISSKFTQERPSKIKQNRARSRNQASKEVRKEASWQTSRQAGRQVGKAGR